MKKEVLYSVLLLVGIHLTARGLEFLGVTAAHFILITLLGTTVILPVGCFYIFIRNSKLETFSRTVIKVSLILLLVYISFLLDNNFNEHTDQIGRDLGNLSLTAGVVMVGFLITIRLVLRTFIIKKEKWYTKSI